METRIQAASGNTTYPGVKKTKEGYEFTLELSRGKEAALLLYQKKNREIQTIEIPFPEESRRGNLVSLLIKGLSKGEICYNYRIDGEIYQDTCARALKNVPPFGVSMEIGEEPKMCGVIQKKDFSWTDRDFVPKPFSESVLYKLQVRSFTMHRSSGVRKKGTFQGIEQKIPYFQELGVTGILLMPAYEYQEIVKSKTRQGKYPQAEEERREEKTKINVWGYTGEAFYYVPKAGFSGTQNPVQEFCHMVNALHEAGLECLMEFYFDHTMEPAKMLDIVRYWKLKYHVDGFRIIGNVCQELFLKDPLLAETKLLFGFLDGERIYGNKEPDYKNGAEYNEGFYYGMRHMLKGDENTAEEFLFRSRRSPRQYGVINYMADQDGMTMMDMVSYEERHNEENGENNQDGKEYNCTWNCGAEGPTRRKEITRLRLQQLKNAFGLLLFSQGTPMIFQGDEWGQTQKGNNNAWCQDNELTWINWNQRKTREELFTFVKQAIAFRKKEKILHLEQELKGTDYRALGYPDVSCHTSQAWFVSKDPGLRHLGMMYCKDYCDRPGEFLFFAWNFHWMSHEIALPGAPEEICWTVKARTDEENQGGFLEEGVLVQEKSIQVPPRTLIILTGKQDETLWGSGSILKRLQGTSF